MNAALAVAIGRRYGVTWDHIREKLEAYSPLPMRWQVGRIGRLRVVNDAYNANPLSMRASIETFASEPGGGSKWLVLADMLELGEGERQEHLDVGRFVGAGTWAGLLAVGRRGEWMAAGAEEAGMRSDRVWRCADPAEAAAVLREHAAPGDAVFLKGSRGMHLEEVTRYLAEPRESDVPNV
jgi:UDP-N-acetylmuramyl pentapeptide synthase